MPLLRRSAPPVVAVLGTALIGVTVLASGATAATTGVEVRDYEYVPASIQLVAGDTVRWTWRSEDRHSVTAPGVFDSHPDCTPLTPEACGANGASFAWTSSEPGTVEYGCRLHPDRMRGTITVVEAPAEPSPPDPPPPPASPAPSPSPAPPPPPPPSPAPSPAASPTPASSPTPDPRPTRRSAPSLGFGEATEVAPSPAATADDDADVAPPLVSDTSPPLEPFPAPPSPSPSPDPVADDVVAVGPPGGAGRDAVRIAGAAVVALSVLVFGRVVLFGRPWA